MKKSRCNDNKKICDKFICTSQLDYQEENDDDDDIRSSADVLNYDLGCSISSEHKYNKNEKDALLETAF